MFTFSVDVCNMSAVQRAFLSWLRPPVGALILLQPGLLSCVRSVTTGRQRHIFQSGGLQSGWQCCVRAPPSMSQLKEKVVCGLERRERKEGGCGPLFSNCVFMSPLTVSVPQYFTMEAIVCLGEKAWVFCFNHFLKSYV